MERDETAKTAGSVDFDLQAAVESGRDGLTTHVPEGRLKFSMVSGIHVILPITDEVRKQREKERLDRWKAEKAEKGKQLKEKGKEKKETGGKKTKEKEREGKAKKEEEKAEGKKKAGMEKVPEDKVAGKESTAMVRPKDKDTSLFTEMSDVVRAKLSELKGAKAKLGDSQGVKSKLPETSKSPSKKASRVTFSAAGSHESKASSTIPSKNAVRGELKEKAARWQQKTSTVPSLVDRALSPILRKERPISFPTVVQLEKAFRDPALLKPTTRPAIRSTGEFIPVIDDDAPVILTRPRKHIVGSPAAKSSPKGGSTAARSPPKGGFTAAKSPPKEPKSELFPFGAIRLNEPKDDRVAKKLKQAKATALKSIDAKDKSKEAKALQQPKGGASAGAKTKQTAFAREDKLVGIDKYIKRRRTSVMKERKDLKELRRKQSQETVKKERDMGMEDLAAGVGEKILSVATSHESSVMAGGKETPHMGHLAYTLSRDEIKRDQIPGPAAITTALQHLRGAVQDSWGVWGGVVGGHSQLGQECEAEVVKFVSTMVEQLLRSRFRQQRKTKKKAKDEEWYASYTFVEKEEEEEEKEEEGEDEEDLRVLRRLREQEEIGKRFLQAGEKISLENVRGRLGLEGQASTSSSTALYRMDERRLSAISRQAVYGESYREQPPARVTTPDMAETQKVGKRKRKRPWKRDLQNAD